MTFCRVFTLILSFLLIPSVNAYEEYFIDYGSDILKQINHEEAVAGIYISDSLTSSNVPKYIDFLSKNLEGFDTVVNSNRKYFFKTVTEKSTYFTSLNSNKKYFVEVGEIKIALSVQGYFAKFNNIGVIGFNRINNNDELFATMIHESIHAIHYENGFKDSGSMYDILSVDVKKLSLEQLYKNLNWVDRELDAHKKTAYFLTKILKNAKILNFLETTEEGLRKGINEELYKYSLYEQEEKELINSIIRFIS